MLCGCSGALKRSWDHLEGFFAAVMFEGYLKGEQEQRGIFSFFHLDAYWNLEGLIHKAELLHEVFAQTWTAVFSLHTNHVALSCRKNES